MNEHNLSQLNQFIRIDRSGNDDMVLSIAILEWSGPHSPVMTWQVYDKNLPHELSEEAIYSLLIQDDRFFRICSQCDRLSLVGYMHSDDICQNCAEEYDGVVY